MQFKQLPHTELRFDVETLEDRRMLAGNVNVAVSGAGDITINGDNASNNVVLGQIDYDDGVGPRLHIRAEGDTQITFNGSTNIFHWLTGSSVDSNVRVNLRGGDDTFTLTNSLIGDVRGAMGQGSDDFRFINSNVQGDLIWNAGPGASNDRVVVSGTSLVAGNTRIRLGASTSDFESGGIVRDIFASNTFSRFVGSVHVSQGGGIGQVNPLSQFDDEVRLSLGAGNDTVITVNADYSKELSLKTAGGNDFISFAGTVFRNDVSVNSGSGEDSIQFSDVGLGNEYALRVVSGGGDDSVVIEGAFRGLVSVSTGGGNDTLQFWSSEIIDVNSRVNGGGGAEDIFTYELGQTPPQIMGFEFVIEE